MPGFSESCVTNQHAACADPECRCRCHVKTQKLIAQAAAQTQPGSVQVEIQTGSSICPKCNQPQRPTDTFCRRDGTKLIQAKKCLDCESYGDPTDVYCFCCGIEHGKTRRIPVEAAAEVEPSEPLVDRIAEMLAAGGKVEVS
jgi:hypothetical protein